MLDRQNGRAEIEMKVRESKEKRVDWLGQDPVRKSKYFPQKDDGYQKPEKVLGLIPFEVAGTITPAVSYQLIIRSIKPLIGRHRDDDLFTGDPE